MAENDLEIPLKDIKADPQNKLDLKDIGGKPQVPCLIIDGKALYESKDIMDWLQENVVA